MKFIKKYGKRFIPLFVLCCILFSTFNFQNVYASDSSLKIYSILSDEFIIGDGYQGDILRSQFYIQSCVSSSPVYCIGIVNNNFLYYYAISVDSFTLNFRNEQYVDGSLSSDDVTVFSSPDKVSTSLGSYYYTRFWNFPFPSSIVDYHCFVPFVRVDGVIDIGYWADAILTLDNWTGFEYSKVGSPDYVNAVDEIGYLQNLSCKTLSMNVSHSHSIPIQKFSFSTTTSTGKKIYDSGMDVQYLITAQSFDSKSSYDSHTVYKSSKSDLFLLSDNVHVYDDSHTNSLSTGTLWFSSSSDTWQNMYLEIKDGLSAFSNMYYDRQLFLRPIYRENVLAPIQYGGWSKVTINSDGSITVEDGVIPQLDDNPDATPDPDGALLDVSDEYDADHSIGSGENLDDAESNSKEWDKVFDTVDDVVDSFVEFDIRSLDDIFNQLSQGVKGFANLFNIVFSWVPQWLRYSIIAAISIWVFMLIKKAIFG